MGTTLQRGACCANSGDRAASDSGGTGSSGFSPGGDTKPAASAAAALGAAAGDEQPREGHRRRVCVLGIAGASGSGKTTLARALADHFHSPLRPLSGDYFFDTAKMPCHPTWGLDWETPAGFDSALLAGEIRRVVELLATSESVPGRVLIECRERGGARSSSMNVARPRPPAVEAGDKADPLVIVVEGFLLFHDPELAGACTCRVWLDLDLDLGILRRFNRDMGGAGDLDMFSEWYRDLVWSAYERNRPVQLANAEGAALLRLDASLPVETLAAAAAEHLRHLCSGSCCDDAFGM